MASSPGPSIEQIKSSLRNTWMAGDFGMVAKTIAGGGEAFANGLNIPAGARVLDVACGTGNTAIPLARRGFVVTGVDIATNLLAQARERAAAEKNRLRYVPARMPKIDIAVKRARKLHGMSTEPT